MAWYGKAFYFFEIPRRFMTSLWGIPVFWNILPDSDLGYLLAALIAVLCFAYDWFVVSRAPDIRITKAALQAKLAAGERVYFLTVQEVLRRLLWIVAGFGGVIAVSWYWFSHHQEPTLLGRIGVSTMILLIVGYISALGIPVRTKSELPAGQRPFTLDTVYKVQKTLHLTEGSEQFEKSGYALVFGFPIWAVIGILFLWVFLWGMGPSVATGGPGFTGAFDDLAHVLFLCYAMLLPNILIMPMAILDRKRHFILSQSHPAN